MMPEDPPPKLLSKVARRNSTIEIWATDSKTWVRKTYHSRYQVRNEAEAYEVFKNLLAGTPGIRTAAVYDVHTASNSIDMEHISGSTIAEAMSMCGPKILVGIQGPLLDLLVLTNSHQLHLDCDPTNFIIEQNVQELVLIDPICVPMNLSHFSAVVFFWGQVKSFVANCYRVDRWPSYARAWKSLRSAYVSRTSCSQHALSRELSQYAAVVIRWNVEESAHDSLFRRLLRWAVLIPLWTSFRIAFIVSAAFHKRFR